MKLKSTLACPSCGNTENLIGVEYRGAWEDYDDLTRGDRERLSRRPLAAASEGRSTRDA